MIGEILSYCVADMFCLPWLALLSPNAVSDGDVGGSENGTKC